MDIQIDPPARWRRWLPSALGLAILAALVVMLLRPISPVLSAGSTPNSAVQFGDLQLFSEALGTLQSAEQRLLTAEVGATVIAILQQPGATLTPDSPVLQLDNPQLKLQVQSARHQVAKQQSALQAFAATQQHQLLSQQAEVVRLETEVAASALEFRLHQELAEKGIAARVELRRAEFRLQQQQQLLALEQQKIIQLRQQQQAELAQQQLTLQQHQEELQLLFQQQQQLTVTAGMHGMLQQLDVELGQSVAQGQALARIGSQQLLKAQIQLDHRDADKVTVGTEVLLQTVAGNIRGELSRIEAIVQEGTVNAEVRLPASLPAQLRPAQHVQAKVRLGERKNVTYIRQLPGLTPHQTHRVFLQPANTDQHRAFARELTFGALSNGFLIIEQGASGGEVLWAADPARWPQPEINTDT